MYTYVLCICIPLLLPALYDISSSSNTPADSVMAVATQLDLYPRLPSPMWPKAQMRAAGMATNRTVLLAHSLGGVMSQSYVASEYHGIDSLVLYGARSTPRGVPCCRLSVTYAARSPVVAASASAGEAARVEAEWRCELLAGHGAAAASLSLEDLKKLQSITMEEVASAVEQLKAPAARESSSAP